MKCNNKKWDHSWSKLSLEKKIDRLRDRLNYVEDKSEAETRSASQSASAALYVANYCK
jgi:hypothetical protein